MLPAPLARAGGQKWQDAPGLRVLSHVGAMERRRKNNKKNLNLLHFVLFHFQAAPCVGVSAVTSQTLPAWGFSSDARIPSDGVFKT